MFRQSLRAFPKVLALSTLAASSISISAMDDGSSVPKVVTVSEDEDNVAILAGTASKLLAQKICDQLGKSLSPADISNFSDGETSINLRESMRGKDVFVIQTCAAPVNESTMELLLSIGAAKRAGASSVTAIIPYFGYRLNRRGFPISSTHHSRFLWNASYDLAKMLMVLGADKVISVDIQRPGQNHEGCFFKNGLPAETVTTTDLFADYFAKTVNKDAHIVFMSLNTELVKKAKKYQQKLRLARADLTIDCGAFLRNDADIITPMNAWSLEYKGDVKGKEVILISDYIDSTVPLSMITARLLKDGARKVTICASHGTFDVKDLKFVDLSPISQIVVTDSIPLPAVTATTHTTNKIVQLPLAPLLAKIVSSEVKYVANSEFNLDTDEDQFVPE